MRADTLHLIDDLMPEEVRETMRTRSKERDPKGKAWVDERYGGFTPRCWHWEEQVLGRPIVRTRMQLVNRCISLVLESLVVILLSVFDPAPMTEKEKTKAKAKELKRVNADIEQLREISDWLEGEKDRILQGRERWEN